MDAEGETAFRRQLQLPDERLLLYRFVGIFIMVVKPDLSDDIDLVCSAQRFQAVPVLFLQIIGVAGIESIGDMDEGMLAFERHRAFIFFVLTADDEQLADLMRMTVRQDLIDACI